jgi:p-aminobenzoyl-glutamate transporter AbgT
LLAPVMVPMGMQLGLSPELVQGAYRIGDSTTNIVTPLMPYFPLVVTYCQRHCKTCGIGTLVALMLPYSIAFLALWSGLLLAFWGLGVPLGPGSPYAYP